MKDDARRVKEAIDIVSYIQTNGITLKKENRLFVGLCPFHAEKHGSFTVYPDTQSYHCFGCHVDGDVFTFAQKHNNWTFPEALEELARYAGVTLNLSAEAKEKQSRLKRLFALLQDAAELFNRNLFFVEGESARNYLRLQRNIDHDTMTDFLIGYAPSAEAQLQHFQYLKYTNRELIAAGLFGESDNKTLYARFHNRITFPVFDLKGRVVGFTARAMGEEQPKYKNSPECDIFHKSDNLYGISRFEQGRRDFKAHKVVTIVEGCVDVISAHMRGFKGIYAQLGTSLSDQQIDLLCSGEAERIVFCLDNDTAGEAALRRLVEKHIHRAAAKGVGLYAMTVPFGKDADDTLREHPEMWQSAVDAARPVVEVLITRGLTKLGSQATAVEKSNFARELLPILKSDDPFIRQENIITLSRETGVPVDNLQTWLSNLSSIHVVPKPAPAPVIEDTPLPTTAEWVLHGILIHEADYWLRRANSCLFIASDTPMPYALAPLSATDFTDSKLKRFFEATVKAQADDQMIGEYIDNALMPTYERLKCLGEIGEAFGLSFDYDVFVDRVYALRLDRLRKERPTYEANDPAKARECAIAIACLQMAQEDLMD